MAMKFDKVGPFINIGGVQILPKSEILGIFDLDTASTKTDTKRFLKKCETEKHSVTVAQDIPKSFVLTAVGRREMVYFTQLSVSSLEGRWKRKNAHL